nr:MAG TPA: hypothetical protein [Caudoviricetes sp.]DAZ18814.1 MAG TPA: hypothetical protein [Caudoviricetes sp.]
MWRGIEIPPKYLNKQLSFFSFYFLTFFFVEVSLHGIKSQI